LEFIQVETWICIKDGREVVHVSSCQRTTATTRLCVGISNNAIFMVKPENFTDGPLTATRKCSNLRVGFTKL
jgi:hypothetical protein